MQGRMDRREPFVLLDDARASGAAPARLYRAPARILTTRKRGDVASMLDAMRDLLAREGGHLAGYLSYEAGLALEDRLAQRTDGRDTAPLGWFGHFGKYETIAADDVPRWLADHTRGDAPPPRIGPLDPAISMAQYNAAFAHLQRAIRAGDIYQANLTFPLRGSAQGDPVAIYAALRARAAAGYGALIFDGHDWLASFSPELFFSLHEGAIRAKPMKGTRPRGAGPAQDEAAREDLRQSEKDRAENLMIVDLMRNDIARVAIPGSVRVDDHFAIETYPTVHQMVTTVRARIAPGKDALDLLAATFPCGSITGAPKIRAMELIDEVEPFARGAYCGAIGRIEAGGQRKDGTYGAGSAAFNVAIRTIRLRTGENHRHDASLGVGGAIVADSRALDEWRECAVKGKFVRDAALGADLIESMRFTPEAGIPLLEMHLERLKHSAGELGFSFDRHETRNRIHALCFELEAAAKVRLMLARSGAIALEAQPLGQRAQPVICAVLPLPVEPGDWRLAHKSTDRGFYEEAMRVAQGAGAHEALLLRDDGLLTEGCTANIFLPREGAPMLTPAAHLGLLPGVLRRSLIEKGEAVEGDVRMDDLAGGFLLGNSVRGLMPARLLSA
jgi:para-aminobenzoate synthetase/4-amino-4-deoxychorismate lyase